MLHVCVRIEGGSLDITADHKYGGNVGQLFQDCDNLDKVYRCLPLHLILERLPRQNYIEWSVNLQSLCLWHNTGALFYTHTQNTTWFTLERTLLKNYCKSQTTRLAFILLILFSMAFWLKWQHDNWINWRYTIVTESITWLEHTGGSSGLCNHYSTRTLRWKIVPGVLDLVTQ
jgi:hypothetical protein